MNKMKDQKTKPNSWYYVLALFTLVVGCMIAAIILSRGTRGLNASIKDLYDMNRFTQIIVPGSKSLSLSRTGAYAIYYEYHSIVDGAEYISSEEPPELECLLTSEFADREIPVVPDYVETNRYSKFRGREGVLIMSTTIDEPGGYTFSCRYPDGRDEPKIVVTAGHNIEWELLRLLAKTSGSVLSAIAVMFVTSVIAIGIAIVITFLRRLSKKNVMAVQIAEK
jgi:hypothetical protein